MPWNHHAGSPGSYRGWGHLLFPGIYTTNNIQLTNTRKNDHPTCPPDGHAIPNPDSQSDIHRHANPDHLLHADGDVQLRLVNAAIPPVPEQPQGPQAAPVR